MYSYDRRANVKMSPWIWKLFDKIAQVNKSKIDERAKDVALETSIGEDTLKKYPNASDDELVKHALAELDFRWTDVIEHERPRFAKWVNHVITSLSIFDLSPEDETFFDFDIENTSIEVKTTAWGAMYTYDDNNDNGRTEVPATHDLHEDELEATFKKTGAVVDVDWKWEKDPQGYSADVVTFPIKLKWAYSSSELSQKYGAAAFEHAFRAKLPEYKAEVAANPPQAITAPVPGRRPKRR
jgi:hypothetical protein